MKLITFAVPSYNSQDYLEKCIDSLVLGGDEVEVIIINDGSTDDTEKIAHKYVAKYPNIVRIISKENGGHGSGINVGLENARGMYFKVVDSDDWLEKDALKTLIDRIRSHYQGDILADIYVTNFVYNKFSEGKFFIRKFKRHLKNERFTTWSNVGRFYGARVLLMHSLTFKTDKLRACNLELPQHTFYVDNIYAYKPLPKMEKLYYMDINLYHYFIGREDQSVNIKVFTKRYDQQIRVMKEMINAYSYDEIMQLEKGLCKYMLHTLSAIMMITILFTVAEDGEERRDALKEMWSYIKENDYKLYRFLRWRSMPMMVSCLPWRVRGYVMIIGYKYLRRKLKLG